MSFIVTGDVSHSLYILGSFSNDDGDGNENVKKAIGLVVWSEKQLICRCSTNWTFLCLHCTTSSCNCLKRGFMDDVILRLHLHLSRSHGDRWGDTDIATLIGRRKTSTLFTQRYNYSPNASFLFLSLLALFLVKFYLQALLILIRAQTT